MTKAKTKTGNNKKTTLPPVAGAGDDLGLGDGLGIASDDELGAVLGDEKSPEELAADKAFDEEVAKGVQAEKDEFDKAVAEQVEKEVAAMRKDEPKHKPVVDVDLSAGSKEGKIAIMIDEVEEMSNYEVVSVNGKVDQIQRGVVTKVPPSVVHVLENAIATRTVQTTDKFTGELISTERDYSSVPWRRV